MFLAEAAATADHEFNIALIATIGVVATALGVIATAIFGYLTSRNAKRSLSVTETMQQSIKTNHGEPQLGKSVDSVNEKLDTVLQNHEVFKSNQHHMQTILQTVVERLNENSAWHTTHLIEHHGAKPELTLDEIEAAANKPHPKVTRAPRTRTTRKTA